VKTEKIRKFSVPAEAKYLTRIRDFAVKYGEKYGFNLRQLNGFKLSLDEICTNIVRYAYKDIKEKGDIRIEIARTKDKVITRIIDRGKKFDYNTVLNPDIQRYVRERKKGGFGIYLVRQLNDEVHYERAGGANVLTLVNSVEPRPSLRELILQNLKPPSMTIRVRFAVIATLIISCICVGTFYLASLSQKKALTRQYVNNYVSILKNFATTSADYILSERELLITEQIFEIAQEEESVVRLTVIDRNGVIIADKVVKNIGKAYTAPPGIVPLIEQEYLVEEYEDPDYGPCVHLSVPIRIADTFIGKAFTAIEREEIAQVVASRMNRLRIGLYIGLFWFVGIAGLTFMGNMFITPIKKITEEIDRLGKEGVSGSFHFTGFGEFAEISTAFNKMMREIKQSEIKLTDQARLKREMQLAQSIQQTLLPKKVPKTVGFEISAKYDAAMEVGGDYYDFFYVDENSIGMAVGDVSGKGIGGAFIMSIARTALRLEARGIKNASEVLNKLNSTLDGEFKKGMYITLFYIVLDSKRRVINYASAGHTPMILYREETDQLFQLNPRGFPIGLNLGDSRTFRKNIVNEKISLNKGDLLLVYTDGITEAMNPEREEFGEDRLLEVIKKFNSLTTDEFADKFMEEIRNFTRGHTQNDDITFIVIKEKKKYSELQYEKRIKLFDLIEEQGMTVKEACRRVGISRSTYYKLKMLREEQGVEALMPHMDEKEMKVLDFEISRKILAVIRDHPEYSARRIGESLKTETYGPLDIDATFLSRELRRLKLSNRERRIAYVRRIQEHSQKEKAMQDRRPQ